MILICLMLLCHQAGSPAETNDIKVDFTETVTLVSMPLRIMRAGSFYGNLRADHLEVVENGVTIKVRELQEIATPLTLHFLFDLSTSNERSLNLAKRAAGDFLSNSRTGDRVKVSSFSSTYRALTDYSPDSSVWHQALDSLTPMGSTALYDGLDAALRELSHVSGNRVLVLFSDGHDLVSATNETDLLQIVHNFRIPIVFVCMGNNDSQGHALLQAQVNFMQRLARESGGAVLAGKGAFSNALAKRMGDFRQRYLLRFNPPGPNDIKQWRSLVVRVPDCPDCQLQYRSAYSIEGLTRPR